MFFLYLFFIVYLFLLFLIFFYSFTFFFLLLFIFIFLLFFCFSGESKRFLWVLQRLPLCGQCISFLLCVSACFDVFLLAVVCLRVYFEELSEFL